MGPAGVSRGRDGLFTAVIVPECRCCLDGISQVVWSLTARGVRTGEIVVRFDEVHGVKGFHGHGQLDHRKGDWGTLINGTQQAHFEDETRT